MAEVDPVVDAVDRLDGLLRLEFLEVSAERLAGERVPEHGRNDVGIRTAVDGISVKGVAESLSLIGDHTLENVTRQ
jgi:hypothetical protein